VSHLIKFLPGEKLRSVYRFAPSPTGYLHVGGARTAIFNWLLARKTKGLFLLRIEDTDLERSTADAIEQIKKSLKWLGLDWDGQEYHQSTHVQRHIEIANQLLNENKAYRCFCTREELEQKRRRAEALKINQRYDGTCRNLSKQQVEKNLKQGKPFAIRFKVEPGQVEYDDLIHGRTIIDNDTLDDFIILRSDGTPVYQLAVVVDDHDMGVTHVLRGDDHIANTNKQILIYRAMNWDIPQFGHVPLILGPDKQRLSKRHGATSVEEYQKRGILPEALFNYLCLLGWSSGDDREIWTKQELISAFSVQRIGRTPAVFDEQKLLWINAKHLSMKPAQKLIELLHPLLQEEGLTLASRQQERFLYLLDLLKIRAKTLRELLDEARVFFRDPQEYESKGVTKYFSKPLSRELLTKFLKHIQEHDALFESPQTAETILRRFTEMQGVSAAKLIHPLRLALTGKTASAGIFDIMYILGSATVCRRIQQALERIPEEIATND